MTMTQKRYLLPLFIYVVPLPFWIVNSGLKEGLLEWIVYSSVIAVPIIIALALGKTDKLKSRIYCLINFLFFLSVVCLDLFYFFRGGDMCFKGALSVFIFLYWIITSLIFHGFLKVTANKK